MPSLLWDASALVKRFYEEDGSDTVDALFEAGILITSDRYLVRAADAEGLQTINPELISVADVPVLLET